MTGFLERGFQRRTAGMLDPESELYGQMLPGYKRAAVADIIGSFGGSNPGHMNQHLGMLPGLLEQQQAAQRQAANQGTLNQYVQQGTLQPHQAELLANNPELFNHWFEQHYTGRTVAPGAALTFGGREQLARPTTKTMELREALAERDQHPFGSPMWDAWDRQAKKLTEHSPQVAINLGDSGPQIGTIPAGWEAWQTPEGRWQMGMVEDGPVQREQEIARQQQAAVGGFTLRDARILGELVDDMVGNPILRLGRAQIPGTPEARAMKFMDSLRGTVAIEQLLNIKRQGAGLGQVPQAQLDMLSYLMGKLDLALPKEDLHMIIGDIQSRYAEILRLMTPEDLALVGIADRELKALTEQQQRKAEPAPAAPADPGDRPVVRSQEDYDALPSGAVFRDPEGRMRRKP